MKYLALIIIPIVVAGLFVLLCYLTRKVFSKKASLELCQNVKAKQNNGFVSFIDNYFYYICGFVFVTYLLEFLAFWIIRNSLTFMWIFGFFVILVGMFVGYLILLKQHSNKYGTKNWAKDMYENEKTKSILSSLISIIIGLLIGCIILLLFAGRTCGGTVVTFKAAIEAIQLIFLGAFNTGRDASQNLLYGWNGREIGDMLFRATPLILTGLSVALAFKTGLFNIGTPGQYLMGSATALIVALSIPSTTVPTFIIWILAFVIAIAVGVAWGAIPGLFKSLLNVNEVITCIMTNWIAANFVTWLFDNNSGIFRTLLDPSPTKNNAYLYKTTHNGVATAKMGLDKIFAGSQVNGGIIIAIIIAVIVYVVLNKTTFGFELKACGSNRHASQYAGIKAKRSIIFSMMIAGGLAAAGGALYYLSGNTEFYWQTYQTLPAVGFNGIPISLLASNNPLGVCVAAIFMAYLDTAGLQIKYMTTYNEYIASIISAIIVYFSAFSLVIKDILNGRIKLFGYKKKKIENHMTVVETNEANDSSNTEIQTEEEENE